MFLELLAYLSHKDKSSFVFMTQKETFSEMSVRLYQTTLSESEDNCSLLSRVRELAH